MLIILIILIVICIAVELLLLLLRKKKEKKQRERMRKNLYKLIEERVLDHSLKYRMTHTEAAMRESNSPFLYIEFLNTNPQLGYLFPLDEWITIGRSKENKICVYDEMFSRIHCKIGLVEQGLLLQDQGSANGVRIYRGFFKKIDLYGGMQSLLADGDRIRIGNCRMKLKIVYGSEAMR